VTGRRGRRRRKLLDEVKERKGYSHLKEEALDRTVRRVGFGRGFGPVVRQTAKCMNTHVSLYMNCTVRKHHTHTHIQIYIYIYIYTG
jgi:hypothetical protein